MEVIRLILVAVIIAAVLVLLRRELPQLALPASAAAVCVFTVLALTYLSRSLPLLAELESGQGGYVRVLLKGAAITILGGIASDICRDVNENALANAVELVSGAAVLVLALPLLEALMKTALELL